MGILDFFNIKKYKNEIESLQNLPDDTKSKNEEIHYLNLKDELATLSTEKETLLNTCHQLGIKLTQLKYDIDSLEGTLSLQSYGFYEPKYGFENSVLYKNKLAEISSQQKQLVKDKEATHHNLEWVIGDDPKKGKDLILNTIKLSLRTFNSECENIVTKVKYNNLEASEKRIKKVFDEINSLTKIQQVSLRQEYLNLKIAELHLKYEYEVKKQEEKEEQLAIKERMKEETKVLKELESARKKLEKEDIRLKNTAQDLLKKLKNANESEETKLLKKLKEVESKLEELGSTKQDILMREQNTRAGYVYIISNIGSLGEDVYKIGVTRKLDPEESVKELSGASVPFNFDIHAMIFSEDALTLENKLHNRFAKNKINKADSSKGFFRLSLDEIENVVQTEFNIPVEFTRLSEEYRNSHLNTKPATINALILSHATLKDS